LGGPLNRPERFRRREDLLPLPQYEPRTAQLVAGLRAENAVLVAGLTGVSFNEAHRRRVTFGGQLIAMVILFVWKTDNAGNCCVRRTEVTSSSSCGADRNYMDTCDHCHTIVYQTGVRGKEI